MHMNMKALTSHSVGDPTASLSSSLYIDGQNEAQSLRINDQMLLEKTDLKTQLKMLRKGFKAGGSLLIKDGSSSQSINKDVIPPRNDTKQDVEHHS